NWLQIKCKGTAQNPFGIGAKIKVFDANNVLILAQEMTTVRGFYSSVEPIIQVGLGNQTASKIEIEWLEGRHQELSQTFVNQRIILDIQQASVGARTPALPSAKKLWEETPALEGLNFTHQENQFEDFDREKLLPYRFSRRGPCTAVGDLDQNGTEDIYFGGASGQTGQIFLQNPNGSFRLVHQPAFEPDRLCEDTGCLLFDADGDKDLDLYVVSGGNESPPASHVYQDRLYLNDGKGLFLKSENSLPKETGAGSAVCAIDFNKDGATDLVVGGSCMPGMFPNPEESMLLLNDGTGKFANKTEEFAPLLKRPGIVTAIQVADVDKDGSQDIIIAGEWMPITILKWTGAKFEESTQKLGLEHTHGIWRSLTVLDVDQDGDLDIIAGNIGLNTRFKASIEAPLRLFAQDFDKNGSLDPVMVQAENGIYHPVIHREALAFQMPTIRRKFTRNTPYASAPIESILDPELILSGTKLKVETLVSQWFENSNGRFHGHNLPQEAQLSAVTKILADDLNGDHNPDLLVLGNDYGMETETYQLDASNGLVLLGNGRGGFLKEKNGIGATGEVRSAAKIKGVAHMEYLVIANNNAPIQVFKRISSTN
ncbi:MAG: VCBS repeat-containing protein, partial [Saprospiraceae bacterium]|nr:VCBS repeat-containing protein [Saprospiraceae bacterium]